MKTALLIAIILLNSSISFAEEILVVSSNASNIDKVTLNQVKESFLGNAQKTDQGIEVIANDRKSSPDDLRAKFYKTVIGMSTTQLKAYWSQRIFTGRGYPPKSSNDLTDLKKDLNENKSFISFVLPSELDPSMKTLLKVEVK
jgi:hypothetical protein